MAGTRLFTALVPPAAVRTEMAGLAAPLAGVRWTPAENLHLTLRFIGETGEHGLERFAAALARVGVLLAALIVPVMATGLTGTGSLALAVVAFAALQTGRIPAWAVVAATAALGACLM